MPKLNYVENTLHKAGYTLRADHSDRLYRRYEDTVGKGRPDIGFMVNSFGEVDKHFNVHGLVMSGYTLTPTVDGIKDAIRIASINR